MLQVNKISNVMPARQKVDGVGGGGGGGGGGMNAFLLLVYAMVPRSSHFCRGAADIKKGIYHL